MPHTITSMALFCDFENIALGVRDAKYAKFDIDRVLERLLLKGSIVVKKAFCDWERYRDFKAPMHEASFLLEATLGLINIEQNNIIKIFSVVAVMLMPPTLVASIYGMNFHFMPELSWHLGYPWAILLMAISGLVPYLFFRRRGWL